MKDTSGENSPDSGAIDLMKYYNNDPKYIDYKRASSSEKDILGLLWLTKLDLK